MDLLPSFSDPTEDMLLTILCKSDRECNVRHTTMEQATIQRDSCPSLVG